MRWELNQFKPKLSALLGVRRGNAANGNADAGSGSAANAGGVGQHGPPPSGPGSGGYQHASSSSAAAGGDVGRGEDLQTAKGGDGKHHHPDGKGGWSGKLIRQETFSKLTKRKLSSIMRKVSYPDFLFLKNLLVIVIGDQIFLLSFEGRISSFFFCDTLKGSCGNREIPEAVLYFISLLRMSSF